MIKENELRIGNWVECTFIGYTHIDKISYDDILALAPIGIELTPDIMDKTNLEKDIDAPYSKDEYAYDSKKETPFHLLCKNGIYTFWGLRIDYLHELQNLYFALTKEEMIVQL